MLRNITKAALIALIVNAMFFTVLITAESLDNTLAILVELEDFNSENTSGEGGETLLVLKGDSYLHDGKIRVAKASGNQAGTVVRRNQIRLQDGFSTYFSFQISKGTSSQYADGLAFIIYESDEVKVGNTGYGLGYAGIDKSIAVEFDVWRNTESHVNDPTTPHAAIMLNGVANHVGVPSNAWAWYSAIQGSKIHAWVDYNEGIVNVTFGTSDERGNSVNRNITREVGEFLKGKDVFVGFSASTGGSNADHDLHKWYFKDSYVVGGLDPNGSYVQAASTVSMNLIGDFIEIKLLDSAGNSMSNQTFEVYLNNEFKGAYYSGDDGKYDYSLSSLNAGDHIIRVVGHGGSTNFLNFSISKNSQSITFEGGHWQNKTYGDEPFSLVANSSSSLPVTFHSSDPSIADVNGNIVTILGGGTVEITATQAGNSEYIEADPINIELDISKRNLSIEDLNNLSIANKEYDGTNMHTGATSSWVTNAINGDQIEFSYQVIFPQINQSDGESLPVEITNIEIKNSPAINDYNLITTSGSAIASIYKREVIALIDIDDKVYDGNKSASASMALDRKVSTDEVFVSGDVEFLSIDVGENKEVTGSNIMLFGSDANNYNLIGANFNTPKISKKPLYLTSNSTSKEYGEDDPELSAAFEGFVAGESYEDFTIDYDITRDPGEYVGEYYIEVLLNDLGLTNYDLQVRDRCNAAAGVFSINPRSLTITAGSATKTYDGTDLVLSEFDVTEGSLASNEVIRDLTVIGSQRYVGISQNVPSNAFIEKELGERSGPVNLASNYDITYNSGLLEIEKASYEIEIVSESDSKVYDGNPLYNEGYIIIGDLATNDTPLVEVIGGLSRAGVEENVIGYVAILNEETVDVTENYIIKLTPGLLEVSKRPLTIAASNVIKVYNGEDQQGEDYFIKEGTLVENEVIASVEFVGSQRYVGINSIMPTNAIIQQEAGRRSLPSHLSDNYDITYIAGQIEVVTAEIEITIVPDSLTKTYDGKSLEAEGFTVVGSLPSTNEVVEVDMIGSVLNVGQDLAKVERVTVWNDGIDVSENYIISSEDGKLEVKPKPLYVYAQNYSKIYGDEDPAIYLTYSGFIDGEDEDNLLDLPIATRENGEDVGSYAINIDHPTITSLRSLSIGEAIENYAIVPESGSLTIEKRDLFIRADNKAKYEGDNDPRLTASVRGYALGDTLTDVFGDVEIVLERARGERLGRYIITPKLSDADFEAENYNLIFEIGTLRIRGFPEPEKISNDEQGPVIRVFTDDDIEEKPIEVTKVEDINKLIVSVSEQAKDVGVVLTGEVVKNLADDETTIEIESNEVTYSIPAKEINIESVANLLSVSEDELQKIEVDIRINKVNEEKDFEIRESALSQNLEIVVEPVEFRIVANTMYSSGEYKEVEVSRFSQFVERLIKIPDNVDPTRITTGVVFNMDGTFSHVPTVVFKVDGVYYAKINSLTNSTYSVIYNEAEISTVDSHWARTPINVLVKRLVIDTPETFKLNENITRAEFATYITKALGLYRTDFDIKCGFVDIENESTYARAVSIANDFGIISGYPDKTFRPFELISRQEAMAMYANAMDLVNLTVVEPDRILAYRDNNIISTWAYQSVKSAIGAKVFNGRSSDIIDPLGTLTHAEAATAIWNLLVESELIDR